MNWHKYSLAWFVWLFTGAAGVYTTAADQEVIASQQATALVQLLFDGESTNLGDFRKFKDIVGPIHLAPEINKKLQEVRADIHALGAEATKKYDPFTWTLFLLQASALAYPYDAEGTLIRHEVKWSERPSVQVDCFRFTLATELAKLNAATRSLHQRRAEYIRTAIKQMPDHILTGVMGGLTGLSDSSIQVNPLAQAALLKCLAELIEREKSQGRIPLQASSWVTRLKAGESVSCDYRLLCRYLTVVSRHAVRLDKLRSQSLNVTLPDLRRQFFALVLAGCLQHCDSNLELPVEVDGGRPVLVGKVFEEIASYERETKKSDLVSDWLNIVNAWLANKDGPDMQPDSRSRKSTQSLLLFAFDTDSRQPDAGLAASTVLQCLSLFFASLASEFPITHDGKALQLESLPRYTFDGQNGTEAPEIIRPSFSQGSPSEKDLEVVQLGLDYFYKLNSRRDILRLPQNRQTYAALLLYSFTRFAHDNQRAKPKNEQQQAFSTGLQRLGEFSKNNDAPERTLFFAHARWTPQYWQRETWLTDAQGIIRKSEPFQCPREWLAYHGAHVETLATLTERLCLPMSLMPIDIDSNGRGASSRDVLLLKSLHNRPNDSEPAVTNLYARLFDTIYHGQLIIGKREEVKRYQLADVVDAAPSTNTENESRSDVLSVAISTNPPMTEEDFSHLFLSAEPNEAGPISLVYYNLTKPYVIAEPEKSFLLFQKCDAQQHAKLTEFYKVDPWVKDRSDLTPGRLDNPLSATWASEFGGQYLYSNALRTIVQLAYARIQEQQASKQHLLAGFIFEPEVANGEWLKNSGEQLREARQRYLRGQAVYLSLSNADQLEKLGLSVHDVVRLYLPQQKVPEHFRDLTAIRICRPTPLEVIPVNAPSQRTGSLGVQSPVGSDSILAHGLFSGVNRTRNAINRIDAGQDAFGFTGAIQAVSGPEELYKKLDNLAGYLETANITEVLAHLRKRLALQHEEQVAMAMDRRIYEEGFRLAAIGQKIAASKMRENVAALELNFREADEVAIHFDTESARQLAEAMLNEAAGELARENIIKYRAKATEAQVEMLITALPGYLLHLWKAKHSLDRSSEHLRDLNAELLKAREEYLRHKKKDIGMIVWGATVKLMDIIAVANGLPPIGSLVNRSVDGIVAASEGRWDDVRKSVVDVAKELEGNEKVRDFVNGKLDKAVEKLKNSGAGKVAVKLTQKVRNSKTLGSLGEFAKKSGLDNFAEAKALSVFNRAGKSLLPDKLVDSVIPPEDFQWADLKGEEMKQFLVTYGTDQGKEALKELSRTGLIKAMQWLDSDDKPDGEAKTESSDGSDDSELVKVIKTMAKFDPAKHEDFKSALTEIRKSAKEAATESMNELFTGLEQKHKLSVAAALAEIEVRKVDNKVTVEDPELEELFKSLHDKLLKEGEGSAAEFWTSSFPEFLNKKGWKEETKELFKKSFNWENLKNGQLPVDKFFGSLGQAFVNGTFQLQLARIGDDAFDLEKFRTVVAEMDSAFKETLVEMESTIELAVSIAVTAKYRPETKGDLIAVSSEWELELDALMEKLTDEEMRENLNVYYNAVKARFRQVNLKEMLDKDTFDQMMNPPEVALKKEYTDAFTTIDAALRGAKSVVMGLSAQESAIRDGMNNLTTANPNEFSTEVKKLFEPFEKAISNENGQGASDLLKVAIDSAGYPSLTIKEYLENPNNLAGLWANVEHERRKSKNTIKRMEGESEPEPVEGEIEKLEKELTKLREQAKRARNASRPNLGNIEKEIKREQERLDASRAALEAAKANFDEGGVYSEKAVDDAWRAAENALFEQLKKDFELMDDEKPVLFPHLIKEGRLKDIPEAERNEVLYGLTRDVAKKIVSKSQDSTGLFQHALREHNSVYEAHLEEIAKHFDVNAAQHKAMSAALHASSQRARTNAGAIRKQQAEIEMEVAKLVTEELRELQKAQFERLHAAEYDYQAASTQRDLALIEMWEFDQSGANAKVLSPTEVRLAAREVWRCFRDICFILKYYEGSQEYATKFSEFLHGNDARDILNHAGQWKPDAIRSAIKKLEFQGLVDKYDRSRDRPTNVVFNSVPEEPGLKITPAMIRASGRRIAEVDDTSDAKDYYSLLVEVLPIPGGNLSAVIENPAPRLNDPRLESLNLADENTNSINLVSPPEQRQKGRQPRIRVYVSEGPLRFRSRLSFVGINASNARGTSRVFLYRHLGDGFITMPPVGTGKKQVVPIHWESNPSQRANTSLIGKAQNVESVSYFENYKRDDTSSLEGVSKKIASALHNDEGSRDAFFMYPLCGTYELFVPAEFADNTDEKSNPFVQVYFVGCATTE